jgi:hypothetical protein
MLMTIKGVCRRGASRLALALALILGVFVTFGVAAVAAAPGEDVPVGVDSQVDSLFSLDPFVVEILLGSAIPFVIAFLTNQNIVAWFKKLLLAALSAISGMITTAAVSDNGDSIISVASLKAAAIAFLMAAGVYSAVVRNSNTEAKLQTVGPDIGPRKAA